MGLVLSVVRFPACPGLEERQTLTFARLLLSAAIRRRGASWVLQWVFASCPLQAMATADTRQSNSLYSQFEMETVSECEKTVTAILASVKAREEGRKPGQPPTSMSRPGAVAPMGGQGRPGVSGGMMPGATNSAMLSQPRQLPNYNRFNCSLSC